MNGPARATAAASPGSSGDQANGLTGEAPAPDILPGQHGTLSLPLPGGWQQYDVLYLTAKDPSGREIFTWSWPISRPQAIVRRIVDTTGPTPVTITDNDTSYTLTANGVRASFGKKSGLLRQVSDDKGVIPFTNGPALSVGAADFQRLDYRQEGKISYWNPFSPDKVFARHSNGRCIPPAG